MRRRHVQRMVFALIAFVWAVFTVSQNAWCDNNDNNYVCIWPAGMQYFPTVGVTQGCLALENVPTGMCPGQWVQVKANGGNDCDNVIGGVGGACGNSTCQPTYTCVHGMRNDYKPYTWTVTGYVDLVIPHSGTPTGVLEEYCDVQAMPEWSNGTIEVKIEREEATTAIDPWTTNTLCPSPSDHAIITVTKPTPKMRSVVHNSSVSPADYIDAFRTWSLQARGDWDGLPGWYNPYPSGGTADNHECVEFQVSVDTSDSRMQRYMIKGSIPQGVVANVYVVDQIYRNANLTDPVLAYGHQPGQQVFLSNNSPENVTKTCIIGHEWGHNYNKPHYCVDYDVMATGDPIECPNVHYLGVNLGGPDIGGWANQTADDLP